MRFLWELLPVWAILTGVAMVACTPEGQGPEEPPVASPEPEAEEVILYVGPTLVDCVGVAPQKCLLVKEDPAGEYQFFYDSIEGFEYETGYTYQLRVKKEPVANPPADASSIKWTLIEVVEKNMSLENKLWGLASYLNLDGQMVEVLPGSKVTAEFNDGSVTGTASCNNYFGSYELSGNVLTFGPLGMTEMYCAEPAGVMEQEGQYLALLQTVKAFQIEEERLRLAGENGTTVLEYLLIQPAALEGPEWILSQYNNGKEAVVTTLLGSEITAIFADGTVSGSAGCNRYTASYEVIDNAISIGPAATTRMFCGEPEGIMDQENAFLAALQTAATYQIKADVLDMFDSEGARAATFRVASPPEEATFDSSINVDLANLEYLSEVTQSGVAPLVDGAYREKVDPDAASETIVAITDHVASGQLSNGQEAVAVILVTTTGGTGTFYSLHLIQEIDGELVNTAAIFLGDRVDITNLVFVGGEVLVEMVNQGPDDPMCCPTQQVVNTYDLQNGELVETSSRVIGTIESN